MTEPLILECDLEFRNRDRGARRTLQVVDPNLPAPTGRVPRIARLMALALHFEELIRNGHIDDQAELARVGKVTRARISQIMSLLHLAPDIQEAILFLPATLSGRSPIHLHMLRPICATPNWQRQRVRWRAMVRACGLG